MTPEQIAALRQLAAGDQPIDPTALRPLVDAAVQWGTASAEAAARTQRELAYARAGLPPEATPIAEAVYLATPADGRPDAAAWAASTVPTAPWAAGYRQAAPASAPPAGGSSPPPAGAPPAAPPPPAGAPPVTPIPPATPPPPGLPPVDAGVTPPPSSRTAVDYTAVNAAVARGDTHALKQLRAAQRAELGLPPLS